jgi:endoglucanase
VIDMRRKGGRRRCLQAGAALAGLGWLGAVAPAAAEGAEGAGCAAWPAWQSFQAAFMGAQDRVVDPASAQAHTVSEGQAYALFFALVAGDRERFERILRWTEEQLAGGDLSLRLPAWRWGRRADGGEGVLDGNSAADADLWIVYALGEAGRLWRERRYLALSSVLAERVLLEETTVLPGLGRTLLPAPHGFSFDGRRWRLNPCYLPLFLGRWLAVRSGDARWTEVLHSQIRLLRESAPRGFAPDWIDYRAPGEAGPPAGIAAAGDGAAERSGSYDAVRVYLWLGLSDDREPERAALLRHFAPMADLVERGGVVPLSVDAFDGQARGSGPAGFQAALLPFLDASGRAAAVRRLELALQQQGVPGDAYYEQALSLFALGFRERRYRFAADGGLRPAWQACSP